MRFSPPALPCTFARRLGRRPRWKLEMHCPRCSFLIEPVVAIAVEVDHCGRCQGTFFDSGEAPRVFGEGARFETWQELWLAHEASPSLLRCPKDGTRLLTHGVSLMDASVLVDVCPHCHGMWLDRDEGKQLHALVAGARAAEQTAQRGHGVGGYLFQFLTQMPVEVWNPVRRRPHLVHGLLLVLAVGFMLELLEKAELWAQPGLWMLVPREVLGGQHAWTLLTHGFLHGGWLHLLSNLYFLWIFGDNVEDRLGKRQFVILYVAALVAGGLAHALANPHSRAPMLGASGAIAGLMGAYLVLFPRVRLWVMLLVVRIRIRVVWYLGAWVALQVLMQATGARGTAWMAHLGGFAVGALTAALLRPRPALQRLQV
jgi:membrane associated rhomboid family serine protease/Zn-finger nucleic acid-binding protein